VHYDIKNKFFAWLDRRLHFVDAFVNSELRSIRAHFEGIAAPYSEPASILPYSRSGNCVGQAERARSGRRALFSCTDAPIRDRRSRLQKGFVILSAAREVEGSLTICDYFSKNN
jgi:hypothetical protein